MDAIWLAILLRGIERNVFAISALSLAILGALLFKWGAYDPLKISIQTKDGTKLNWSNFGPGTFFAFLAIVLGYYALTTQLQIDTDQLKAFAEAHGKKGAPPDPGKPGPKPLPALVFSGDNVKTLDKFIKELDKFQNANDAQKALEEAQRLDKLAGYLREVYFNTAADLGKSAAKDNIDTQNTVKELKAQANFYEAVQDSRKKVDFESIKTWALQNALAGRKIQGDLNIKN